MKPHLVKLAAAFIIPAITYTTDIVIKDGIWWIYDYDGEILVDVFED